MTLALSPLISDHPVVGTHRKQGRYAWGFQKIVTHGSSNGYTKPFNGVPVTAARGQFFGSIRLLQKSLNWTFKQVRCFLDMLHREGVVTIYHVYRGVDGKPEIIKKGTAKGTGRRALTSIIEINDFNILRQSVAEVENEKGTGLDKRAQEKGTTSVDSGTQKGTYKGSLRSPESIKKDSYGIPKSQKNSKDQGVKISEVEPGMPFLEEADAANGVTAETGREQTSAEHLRDQVQEAFDYYVATIMPYARKNGNDGLPLPRDLTASRIEHLRARIRKDGLDAWKAACDEIPKSKFLRGQSDSSWRLGLDAMAKGGDLYTKISEGQYRDRQTRSGSLPQQYQAHAVQPKDKGWRPPAVQHMAGRYMPGEYNPFEEAEKAGLID